MLTEEVSPRERRKRRQLEAILERALDLFADKGPAGLTIRELAAALDYTPGALYRYVASKGELLQRVQLLAHERIHRALLEDLARFDGQDGEGGPLAPIAAAVEFYLGLGERLPREARLLQFLLGDPRPLLEDDLASAVAPSMLELLQELADRFERAAAAEFLEPGDARGRAVALWSAVQGALQLGKLARLAPELFDARATARAQVRGLLRGWGASVTELERAEGVVS